MVERDGCVATTVWRKHLSVTVNMYEYISNGALRPIVESCVDVYASSVLRLCLAETVSQVHTSALAGHLLASAKG